MQSIQLHISFPLIKMSAFLRSKSPKHGAPMQKYIYVANVLFRKSAFSLF